jgi:hypothetical protein
MSFFATHRSASHKVSDMLPRSRCSLTLAFGLSLLVPDSVRGETTPTRHETAAQQLHRKGVHCMEVIERSACAIENFEALLDERTTQRELVTDAMLRLIKLYRQERRTEEIKPLLRRFWDVGMKRATTGHLPHSARFAPSELNIVASFDVGRVVNAPVMQRLDRDARDHVFTCDEARRRDIRARKRWKKANERAKKEGRPAHEIVYEQLEVEREAEAGRKKREQSPHMKDRQRSAPLFAVAVCPVAKALGHDDTTGWTRMTALLNHQDFGKSVAFAQIPGLAALLAEAQREGRLERVADHRWRLPDLQHHGEEVHLASLDLDELTVATPTMMDTVMATHGKNRRTMNRELAKLVGEVPRDTGFFLAMNQAAVRELGLGAMASSKRSVLEALLPKPKGMQFAAVLHHDIALFTRVPSENPVKMKALVSIAQRMIDGQSEKSATAERWLKNLDVAEAEDRRALLAAYLLSGHDLEKLMMQ